jgi:hypothetical protein
MQLDIQLHVHANGKYYKDVAHACTAINYVLKDFSLLFVPFPVIVLL